MTIPTPPMALLAEDEVTRRVVELLRADVPLDGLLYPAWAETLGENDYRRYAAQPELPEGAQFRAALPRVTVECVGMGFAVEQQDLAPLDGEVAIYVHALAPKGHEDLPALIQARIVTLLLSTSLSSVRIIAAGLSYEGQRRTGRVPSFADAWEVVTQFRSPHVGVIA